MHILSNTKIPVLEISLKINKMIYIWGYSLLVCNNKKCEKPNCMGTADWLSKLWYIHKIEHETIKKNEAFSVNKYEQPPRRNVRRTKEGQYQMYIYSNLPFNYKEERICSLKGYTRHW